MCPNDDRIKKNEYLTLRAHHLLCLQGFQGLGYNTDLTNAFSEAKNKITINPNLKIKVVLQNDDLCLSCPHHHETLTCHKDEEADQRMKQRDSATLTILQKNENDIETWNEWQNLIHKQLTNKSLAQKTCFNCEWQPACLFYITLKD